MNVDTSVSYPHFPQKSRWFPALQQRNTVLAKQSTASITEWGISLSSLDDLCLKDPRDPCGDITLFLLPPLTSQASLLSSNTEDVEIPTSDNSLITSNQALWDVAPRKHRERCSSQVPPAAPQFGLWQLAASSTRRPRLNTGAEARLPLAYLSLRWGKTWVWSPLGTRSRRPGFDYSLPFRSPTAACLLRQGAGWFLFWRCFKEKACTTDPISVCVCLQHACQVPQFLDLLRALMLDSSSSR